MDKRYQVFVSSTYEDLITERQEVMRALLELDCIPSGMELFPAADDDQWTLIKRVIDESDYYIVICAGRYGTIGPSGVSYTEMEYRYAVEAGKPVLGFLHADPATLTVAKSEKTDDGKERLGAFRNLVGKKLCKMWTTPAELGSVVSRGLIQQIRTRPGIGWIRANDAVDSLAAPEILKLRREVEQLQQQLTEARTAAPVGAESLAQGDDTFAIEYVFDTTAPDGDAWQWKDTVQASWNTIFSEVGPVLLAEATDAQVRSALNRLVIEKGRKGRSKLDLQGHTRLRSFTVADRDFQTIKIQLRGLGLIAKSQRPRSLRDTSTYWALTPYGDQVLTTLRAIRKDTSDRYPGD